MSLAALFSFDACDQNQQELFSQAATSASARSQSPCDFEASLQCRGHHQPLRLNAPAAFDQVNLILLTVDDVTDFEVAGVVGSRQT